MKTIQVTDEMYEFLINLSKELNTQDHRGTRMPYFFQVQTKEQIAVPDGCGIEAWHYDGSLIETEEEIQDVIIEYKEWSVEKSEKLYSDLPDWEIEEILEKIGYRKVNYDYRTNLENAFLTSKACDEHIRVNKHNLKSPVNYLSGSFRNPELETVLKFLCELTGGKLHT
jgi:hypothetical protein